MSKELKNSIGVLVGQTGFKVRIKTVKILFWCTTEELLGLLKISILFVFLWWFTIRYVCHFSKGPKGIDSSEIEPKTCKFLVKGGVPTYIGLTMQNDTNVRHKHPDSSDSWLGRCHVTLLRSALWVYSKILLLE